MKSGSPGVLGFLESAKKPQLGSRDQQFSLATEKTGRRMKDDESELAQMFLMFPQIASKTPGESELPALLQK